MKKLSAIRFYDDILLTYHDEVVAQVDINRGRRFGALIINNTRTTFDLERVLNNPLAKTLAEYGYMLADVVELREDRTYIYKTKVAE